MSGVTSDVRPVDRRHLPRWALILVVWTTFGLLNAAQETITSTLRGAPTPWSTALLQWMPVAYAWALFTPVILWLGRRFPFERTTWVRSAAVHAVICSVFVFVLLLGYTFYTATLLSPAPASRPSFDRAVQRFVVWLLWDGLLYWGVLSVGYVVEHQRRLRERELETSRLETQLVQAELQALKMQLQPHFLFNVLHTIGSLVRTGDRDNAVRVVAGLGDLLRRVLDGARQQEVPLKQELEFISAYVAIEQIRFRDRLAVAIAADGEVLEAAVPHLILQPLVENAIRHGIAPHTAAGRLEVRARRLGSTLELIVRDDGPGAGEHTGGDARPGMGLANTRQRLTRLYGRDGELHVGRAAGGGLEARITLPFRLAPGEWRGER